MGRADSPRWVFQLVKSDSGEATEASEADTGELSGTGSVGDHKASIERECPTKAYALDIIINICLNK